MKKLLKVLAKVGAGAATGAVTAVGVSATSGQVPGPTSIASGAISGALAAVGISAPGDAGKIEKLEARILELEAALKLEQTKRMESEFRTLKSPEAR